MDSKKMGNPGFLFQPPIFLPDSLFSAGMGHPTGVETASEGVWNELPSIAFRYRAILCYLPAIVFHYLGVSR